MLKSKNQEVTLFVNYSYNSFHGFSFSENTYSEWKVMCQNMGFLILYGGYIWTSLLKMGCYITPLGHYTILVIKKLQRVVLITGMA